MSDETKWTGREAIERLVGRLHGAASEGDMTADELAVFTPLTRLLELTLIDINRIANAVEKLSNFELTKVGEVVFGTTEHTEGLDLTPEEIETIKALRAGDARVQLVSEPDERERRAMQLMRNHVAAERERGIEITATPWAQLPETIKNHWRREAEINPGNRSENYQDDNRLPG